MDNRLPSALGSTILMLVWHLYYEFISVFVMDKNLHDECLFVSCSVSHTGLMLLYLRTAGSPPSLPRRRPSASWGRGLASQTLTSGIVSSWSQVNTNDLTLSGNSTLCISAPDILRLDHLSSPLEQHQPPVNNLAQTRTSKFSIDMPPKLNFCTFVHLIQINILI